MKEISQNHNYKHSQNPAVLAAEIQQAILMTYTLCRQLHVAAYSRYMNAPCKTIWLISADVQAIPKSVMAGVPADMK